MPAMSTLRMPALDPATVEEKRGSGYPEPYKSRMGDRVKRRLGDACGLTRFGVNLVTLGPGGQSALRPSLLQRLGPPGAAPVKPGASMSAWSFLVRAALFSDASPDVNPTW